jgi:hypothetical protein
LWVQALGIEALKTKLLGYACTGVKGDELKLPIHFSVSALQGKVAGAEISGSDCGLIWWYQDTDSWSFNLKFLQPADLCGGWSDFKITVYLVIRHQTGMQVPTTPAIMVMS